MLGARHVTWHDVLTLAPNALLLGSERGRSKGKRCFLQHSGVLGPFRLFYRQCENGSRISPWKAGWQLTHTFGLCRRTDKWVYVGEGSPHIFWSRSGDTQRRLQLKKLRYGPAVRTVSMGLNLGEGWRLTAVGIIPEWSCMKGWSCTQLIYDRVDWKLIPIIDIWR